MKCLSSVVVVGIGLLLVAVPASTEAASASKNFGAEVGLPVPVTGLPTSGPYQLIQDGSGTGSWVLGRGRQLWKLVPSSEGYRAVDKESLPVGRLIPWSDGQMALITQHRVSWISPSGAWLSRSTPIPKGWRWVDGAGIQIRVGRRVFALSAARNWRQVAILPSSGRGAWVDVALVDENPYQPGPDAADSPIYALWRRGSQTVLKSFELADGWRSHVLALGRPAAGAISNETVVMQRDPLTTATVAPRDDIATETIYRGQIEGALNEYSPILTTMHGHTIAAWSPGFFSDRTPVFTMHGVRVLGQAYEEILYRPSAKTAALVSFQPPDVPVYSPQQVIGPQWKARLVHRAPAPLNASEYLVGHRWIDYRSEESTLIVGKKDYPVSLGMVLADRRRFWLVTARAIWEVGPAGVPQKISWPKGLGPRLGSDWLQDVFAVESGTTLYVAVGNAIPGSEPKQSVKSPLVHLVLVKVSGAHSAVIAQYPRVEGAVTSLAEGPGHMLYVALYTGHHNIDYDMNLPGKGFLVGYDLSTRRWRAVAVPHSAYQSSAVASLRGESIISLVVLPGPRFYFLVQFNPNGADMGLGGSVWELHRDTVQFYDLPAYPMEVPYALTLTPDGRGIFVNGGNTLALLSARRGLGYLGEHGLDASEWLGTRFLYEVPVGRQTSVYEVQTVPLRPKFLIDETVSWP